MSHRGVDAVYVALDGRPVTWLARQLGVTRAVIYRWAHGDRVSRERAADIERVLGVPASTLFPNVEDE